MSKKIGEIAFLAAILIGIVVLAFRPQSNHPVKIGERAPDFVLPGVDGAPVSLAKYRGRVVLVNFWATWCPPCVEETPSLEQFASELHGRGVVVIGVSVDESGRALRAFIKQYHLTYPIARDPGGSMAARFGTFKFPETYILGRDGHLAEKIIGAYDWGDPHIIQFVEDLAGRPTRASM